MTTQTVLTLNRLSKSFGSVKAVRAVSLSLGKGEVLALLGENGAGKTTLMNMLFGHYLPDSGTIDIADHQDIMVPLALGHPQAAISAGIGMVHQHFTLAENLDALDNILLGSEPIFKLKRNRKEARQKIKRIMEESGLSAPLDIPVGRLTVGERQRIEILKALYCDVRILVLDEPTAVLTPQEADLLFANIGLLTQKGLSVIFISHKLREVLAFSNRIAILRHGEKVSELRTKDADERKIAQLMVGGDTEKHSREKLERGNAILRFENLSVTGRSRRESLENVNLEIHEHEILGIAGVSGNGQTALAGAISGMVKPSSGRLLLNNMDVTANHPDIMVASGVGRIPEDRHKDGIVGQMSVAENMVLEDVDSNLFQRFGILNWRNILARSRDLIAKYDVRGPGETAAARLLSGGNIQKLILARVFEKKPIVILANQPTRGLDMGAAASVAERLLDARKRGAAVVLISEDLDELLSLSDRVVVIRDGHLVPAPTLSREALGLLMAGEAA